MANRPAIIRIAIAGFIALCVCTSSGAAQLIAIDIGHSLQASGATSARGKPEFEFNREMAGAVKQAIEAHGGHAFEIGADGKSFDPETRPPEASAGGAKFFLSIHHDSVQPQYLEDWTWQGTPQHFSDRFSGFSLFVSRKNKNLKASLRCASAIGAALKNAGMSIATHHAEHIDGENKQWADQANGVYYFDNLIVLKNASMPAVLLETGVIVNRAEEKFLLDPVVRKGVAIAVSNGLNNCGMLR